MISDKNIEDLEKRFKCYITMDHMDYWKIYSKDQCPWDNGYGIHNLIKTLTTDKNALARIASRK